MLAAAGFTAAVLLVLLSASPARATTVIAKDFDDLCREADMIFAGRVTAIESRWDDQSRHSIETVVTFAVTDAVYGVDSREVRLSFAGGEMGGLREVVDGLPQFQVGEQVVLFASRQRSVSPIIGFHQGCFRVADGHVANADGVPVTGASERSLTLGAGDAPARGMTVDQFLATVRRRLAGRDEATR